MKNENAVDAVRMMRQIRDKISSEMQEMSFEERKRLIEARAEKMVRKLNLHQKMQGAA